jgi:hypothetical protein
MLSSHWQRYSNAISSWGIPMVFDRFNAFISSKLDYITIHRKKDSGFALIDLPST